MSGIHVQHQIAYIITVMTLNSQFGYTLYIFCSLCSIAYNSYVAEFLNPLDYKHLNCLTLYAFWVLAGREFQTEAPENVNEWRNSSCLGLGVYT